MRTAQFGTDQAAFEGLHLGVQTSAVAIFIGDRRCALGLQVEIQFQAQGKALGGVLQLPHIARPGVAQQGCTLAWLQAAFGQAMAAAGGFGKVLEQQQGIFAALAQRGDAQRGNVQAVIQVGAEAALVGGLTEVFLGRGDHPDIQRDQLVTAKAFDHPLLQQAQQLDLDVEGHAFDFIEKQGAAVGEFELADAAFLRAGKGALLVTEQLAFHHRFRQGAGVDGHEWAVAPAGQVVQGARHHFLASTCFAKDQHVAVDPGQRPDLFTQALHGVGLSD